MAERLTERDWQIIIAVDRVRLLTGSQIERVAFPDLTGRSRSVVRWRVLKRLVDWRVLTSLGRRIGGTERGSSGAAYALDSVGQALLKLRNDRQSRGQSRRPGLPGERFIRHVLGVSELFVGLVEAARDGQFALADYRAEPAAWVVDGLGGWLKPDAFLSLSAGDVTDDWFAEIDLDTEHIPTLKRKVETYVDFFQRGQLGANGIMPRVLFVVPDEQRHTAVLAMLNQCSPPVNTLVHVAVADETVAYLTRILRE
ncbi:replication-relaxation family protein [Amycolatopsis sp. H20-H5]|uniref:replication-relaxation family protein n=1 Tax=Amycolatopsis sp. H20-H5 TaxID=3046309 RepID=UPI002DBECF11|nr:replication-relaxation family protein [Amycolatopsis sp. H20-H5]MEC3976230.1 replication-relaxation family protein [Amycolatopsis sp. H20-H5]